MMATIIASVALILVVAGAVRYLYRQRKQGNACAGCALENNCPIMQLYDGKTPSDVKLLPIVDTGCQNGSLRR
ncbi:MAG: FeoB-associated Cys-rich membrane protein [Trueperella sp.]|nr:FeoB-associated Cys-rich membrane protein [Trueperella sp.]